MLIRPVLCFSKIIENEMNDLLLVLTNSSKMVAQILDTGYWILDTGYWILDSL